MLWAVGRIKSRWHFANVYVEPCENSTAFLKKFFYFLTGMVWYWYMVMLNANSNGTQIKYSCVFFFLLSHPILKILQIIRYYLWKGLCPPKTKTSVHPCQYNQIRLLLHSGDFGNQKELLEGYKEWLTVRVST